MKILIINASHRAGNTDQIVKQVNGKLLNHEVRELRLREIEMKLPDGCENCAESESCPHIEDEFSREIEPTLRNYDIYILATPVWSDNVTPLTLIFWNRIVTWCHDDNQYLKGKKLALITHVMADEKSWKNVISWIKGICTWEGCEFIGALTCQSSSKVGEIDLLAEKVEEFVKGLI